MHETARSLPPDAVSRFRGEGYLFLPGWFDAGETARIARWVDEVTALPEVPGRQMVYYEDSLTEPGRRVLSRIEDFCPHHRELDRFLRSGRVAAALEQLLGEPAVLFKEKINYKLPGGDGFRAHQDVQAGWDRYAPEHVTLLVSVDRSTVENGCLELAPGYGHGRLLGEMWKPLGETHVPGAAYVPFPSEPGDALLFDSFIPHRSGPNTTHRPRRVLYVTYNRLTDGDSRRRYYADKRASYPPDCEREPGKSYAFKV